MTVNFVLNDKYPEQWVKSRQTNCMPYKITQIKFDLTPFIYKAILIVPCMLQHFTM